MLTGFLTYQQALMPDVLHWLGITKIDRMFVSIHFMTMERASLTIFALG
jgi:GTP cyclohydrolase II